MERRQVILALLLIVSISSGVIYGVHPLNINDRPNIVIISFEPVRADHFGVYGYHRNTTPNIDRLAQNSTVFYNSFSQAPHTTISLMSTFTSLYPSQHKVTTDKSGSRGFSDDFSTMPEVLHAAGYTTQGVVGGLNVGPGLGFKRGFDSYRLGDISLALNTLNNYERDDSPLFLFYQSFGTHRPYATIEEQRLFRDGNRTYREYKKFIDNIESYQARLEKKYNASNRDAKISRMVYNRTVEMLKSNKTLEKGAINQYDRGLRSNDRKVGRIVNWLKKKDMYDNTIIIVMSQHGTLLGQHDLWGHQHLYTGEIRTPLIIHVPDMDQQKNVTAYVKNLDIAPTVMSLAGIRNSSFSKQAEGVSLVPAMKGKDFKEKWIAANNFNDFQFIDPESKLAFRRSDGDINVYNLSDDPYELHPLNSTDSADILFRKFKEFKDSTTNQPNMTAVYPYYSRR